MTVHASTSVHEDAEITLFGESWPDSISIVFGDQDTLEQITIDFYDPGMLDRLADLASEGAGRLRAKLAEAERERTAATDDRLVEPAAS